MSRYVSDLLSVFNTGFMATVGMVISAEYHLLDVVVFKQCHTATILSMNAVLWHSVEGSLTI